jgi:hypothetical protein
MRGYSFLLRRNNLRWDSPRPNTNTEASMSAQHCSVKNGGKGKGAAHAQYVAGIGKYAGREDVLGVIVGNMPEWSPDGVTFFAAADKHERLNGRSYKEVEFAIPREVADPVAYARKFAEKLLGKNFVYLAGIHSKLASDGLPNTHCHLMFSERRLDGHARSPEHFFKRANSKNPELGGCGKDREMNQREWVQSVRDLHQAHALAHGVELDMRSNAARGLGPAEPKIGPADRRGTVDTYRDVITAHVQELREARKPKPEKAPDEPKPRINKSNTRPKHPARRENRLYHLSECVLDSVGLRGEAEPAKLLPDIGRDNVGQPRQEIQRDRLPRAAPAKRPGAVTVNRYHPDHPDNIKKRELEMRQEAELRITLKTLELDFAVDISAAEKLQGAELKEFCEAAEDAVFDKQMRERQAEKSKISPDPGIPTSKKPPLAPSEAAPVAPGPTLAERMMVSLNALVKWITEKGGEYQQIKGGAQFGPIVQADEFHAVQKIGRSAYVVHEQSKFKEPLQVSEKVLELNGAASAMAQGQGKGGRGD